MTTVKVAVGYLIEQDVMNELLADIDVGDSDEAEVAAEAEGGEIITLNPVICKVINWENRLTPKQKSRIPEILRYVRNDDALDPCSFFVHTRWEYVNTEEEIDKRLRHFESDTAARQRFMEVFGRGIQESHMKFATRAFNSWIRRN